MNKNKVFCSPTVIVERMNGSMYRMCIESLQLKQSNKVKCKKCFLLFCGWTFTVDNLSFYGNPLLKNFGISLI